MTDPVLIVGAGPVGLTLAGELARFGVPVRIVEKAAARTDKSKALVVWSRTLELLDRAGCAGAFVDAGLQVHGAAIMTGTDVIAEVTLDSISSPFRYALMLPQSETERLLEAHLDALGVTVERDVELVGFADDADGLSGTLRHTDGRTETVAASWLVGCDGAHSTVRRQLGMKFEGDTLATNFLLADVHVAGLDVPAGMFPLFWHHQGLVAFFPILRDRYRVMVDIGSQAPHEPTVPEVQAIVDQRCPSGITLSDPVWMSGFGVNERKVADFRSGRVFLAGDAAHIHSPAGGQGMNTGMQDAFNLAWKLALVVGGKVNAHILDSYSIERSAVAAQILSETGRILRAGVIQNPVAQAVRNFAAHHLLGFAAIRHAAADKLAEITIAYPDSPLNGPSARGLHGPTPGQRLIADAPFGAGDAPRFALCAVPGDATAKFLAEFPELLEPAPRPPVHDGGMWLVRPDGYVAAVARAGDFAAMSRHLAALR